MTFYTCIGDHKKGEINGCKIAIIKDNNIVFCLL